MPHLRLVPERLVPQRLVPQRLAPPVADTATVDDRPRVSLRLLMAASGRCSCDDCLLAYRAGNTRAGIIRVSAAALHLLPVAR